MFEWEAITMKRLGSTRAATLLGITGGAAVLAAILRWVQLSNDIKSNGAVLPGRYLYLVIAVLSVAVLAALAVLIRPLRRQTRWEEIFSGGKLPNIRWMLLAHSGLNCLSHYFLILCRIEIINII